MGLLILFISIQTSIYHYHNPKHLRENLTKAMTLSNDIGEKGREVLAAQAHTWNHTFNYINFMLLKCAIQLGIPDIIHRHGRAMTLFELVDALPINKSKGQD